VEVIVETGTASQSPLSPYAAPPGAIISHTIIRQESILFNRATGPMENSPLVFWTDRS